MTQSVTENLLFSFPISYSSVRNQPYLFRNSDGRVPDAIIYPDPRKIHPPTRTGFRWFTQMFAFWADRMHVTARKVRGPRIARKGVHGNSFEYISYSTHSHDNRKYFFAKWEGYRGILIPGSPIRRIRIPSSSSSFRDYGRVCTLSI